MLRDLNIKTNIKRAGQGIVILLALFLFSSPALAVTSVSPLVYTNAGDEFVITTDETYPCWIGFDNEQPPLYYSGSCSNFNAAATFSETLETLGSDTRFGLDLPIVFVTQDEMDNFTLCPDNSMSCLMENFPSVTVVYQPQGETATSSCTTSSATSTLDCLIGPAINTSVYFATYFIVNFWGYILVFGILAAIGGLTIGWLMNLKKGKPIFK